MPAEGVVRNAEGAELDDACAPTETACVPPPARLSRLPYIPALDGLRAIAVAVVLLYHADQTWIPGGFLGVDVFFVISGYLITCLLLSDWQQHGGIRLGRFWYRRARRLLPAVFTMLFVVSLYAILFLPDVLDQLRGEVTAALLYVENWFLVFRDLSYFQSAGRPPLLQHVWSLAVEEQFYVFWPLILVAVLSVWGRRRPTLLVGILIGVAISTIEMAVLYRPYTDPSRVYYGTDTRVATLLVGCALAFVWAPWRLVGKAGRNAGIVLDVGALFSAVVLFWMFLNVQFFDPYLYRGGFLLAAMASALLVAATVHPASRLVPWLLGFSVLRWIGVRSYGIYLWHWPIFMVTRPHSDVPISGLPLLVLRLALTFGVAALSYRFVEEPVRHGALERRWAQYRGGTDGGRRRLAACFGLATVVAVVGVAVILVGFVTGGTASTPEGFPKQSSVLLTPSSTENTVAADPATTTAPTTGASAQVPPTTPASGAPPPAVTAIGDSVMLGAASQLIGALDGLLGTPTVPHVTTVDAAESRQFSTGVDVVQDFKNRGALGQDVIVQLGTNGTVDPGDLDRMMDILNDRNRVVIVNVKVPRPWEQQVNDALAAEVKKYKNAMLLDWRSYASQRPEFFYDDGIHLRPEGADAYAQLVADALVAAR